jgi:hypothetical protein
MSYTGKFFVSKSNYNIFNDAFVNDLIINTEKNTQKILLGVGSNVNSTMVINNGNIGIGTIYPTEKLDIIGNLRVSSNIYTYGSIGIGTNNTLNNSLYVLGDIKNTGTIYTSNMQIQGDLTVSGTQTILNTDIKVTDQFVVSNIGTDTAVKIYQLEQNQNSVEVYNNNNIAFIVGNNANVGIRTNAPIAPFDVFCDSLFQGNTTINCNLSVNSIANIQTLNCFCNLTVERDVFCNSNITIKANLYCSNLNNILLNYDVPNVTVINTNITTTYIDLTLDSVIQDKDSFGNLIPNIDKLYISYSNTTNNLSSIASNNVQNIKNIKLNCSENSNYYSTTTNENDTYNIFGMISNSNYKISMYYENSRGNSLSNYTIDLATTKMGPPSTIRNLNITSLNSNLYINFDSPLYTDQYNNLNVSSIENYYLYYNAKESIRFNGVTHSNTITSSNNNFTLSNYKNELYAGTLYNFNIYSKNKNLNSNSQSVSNMILTGFDSNDFIYGENLSNVIYLENSNNFYDYNTYYAIDCGSNGPTSSIIVSKSNYTRLMNSNNLFTKYTNTSNLRLFYHPNPNDSNNVGITHIIGSLSITNKTYTSNLETLSFNINEFDSNLTVSSNNNKYISYSLCNLNSNNYFLEGDLELSINYNSNTSNASYNKYTLNTQLNYNNYIGWQLLSNIDVEKTYPPSAMTVSDSYQNINGYNYKVTASSSSSSSYLAFDSNTSTCWTSANFLYNGGTGYYNPSSTQSTTVSGSNCKGEWIQLEFPYNVVISKMKIYGYTGTTNISSQIKSFTLAGSIDNSTWYYIDTQSNITYIANETKSFDFPLNNTLYKYYRVIVTQNNGGGQAWLKVYGLNFYGTIEHIDYSSNISTNVITTTNSNLYFKSAVFPNNSNINNGNIDFEYYYDNIKSIGNPALSNFTYTLNANNINLVSSIPNSSNYDLQYKVSLSNAASYWTVNPIIKLESSNNTTIYRELTTLNNYYYYNNSVLTQINKNNLSNGLSPYNYNLTFSETESIKLSSNVSYDNINLQLTGYSILTSNTSNASIGYFNYNSNSLLHPHLSNNSSTNSYGQRVFFNCSNILDYPSIDLITSYDNNSNIAFSNYSKEAVLFNGLYYGNNTDVWKKDWSLISSSSYNYSNVTSNNTRWCTTLYSNIDGSSTNLQINIDSNSDDDKLLYVKYYSSELGYESVWFCNSNDYNGKSFYLNRSNEDGIKNISMIDTISTKYIKSPPLTDLTVYLALGIPYTNSNSSFYGVRITNI